VLRASRPVFNAFGYSLYDLRGTAALEASRPAATASSTLSGAFPASGATDGSLANWGNGGGWSSAGTPAPGHPEFLALTYPEPRSIRRAALVSQLDAGGALKSFVLQYESGGSWKDIPETRVASGADDGSWEFEFRPVTAARFRLLVTEAAGKYARVMEIRLDESGPRGKISDSGFPDLPDTKSAGR
jgi:hypothetical protein